MSRFGRRLRVALREFLEPGAIRHEPNADWVNPDKLYVHGQELWRRNRALDDRFTFSYDGQLHYVTEDDRDALTASDAYPTGDFTHDDVGLLQQRRGRELPSRPLSSNTLLKDDQALQGRTGTYLGIHYVSFWHGPRPEVFARLLPGCLRELERMGKASDRSFLSTPYTGITSLEGGVAKFQEGVAKLTPEQQEKADLARRLHLMKPAEKREAMAKLGLAAGGARSPWRDEAVQAGIARPGQKLWALHSEGRHGPL